MLQFGTWHRYLCDKIIMSFMKYKETWKGTIKNSLKDMEGWRDSCLSIEELLCLQLLGYSSRQLYGEMEYGGSLKAVVSKSIHELDKAKRILDRQAKAGVATIPYYAETYPRHFRNLGMDAPPLIHVLGNEKLLNREDNVAIIGARAADKEGLDIAYRLANQMGRQEHVVISGLAEGCDTAAHRGCLDAGGQTVAIVASGLDIVYPKSNKALQDKILANGGAVLSEHPFGVKANPKRLVARCRMQVVLTQSVIVAQCPVVSGTMYAVHFAQEYNEYSYDGWESSIYAVSFAEWKERNSGNEYLLDSGRAVPIIPGQRLALDDCNMLVLE